MYRNKYSIQNINNGALIGVSAMPLKDSTSDSQNTFNMARHTFIETVPSSAVPVETQLKKKWSGNSSNRDASQVARNRRNVAVGQGLNADEGLYAFTSYSDINASTHALRRVRAGGYVAPAKKNARKTNAPTPSFSPAATNGSLKNFYGNNAPYLYH
jgi:hypothetical protein